MVLASVGLFTILIIVLVIVVILLLVGRGRF